MVHHAQILGKPEGTCQELQLVHCDMSLIKCQIVHILYLTWFPSLQWMVMLLIQAIGLDHPLDGITNPKYKLLRFLTTNFFMKEKALAFSWDRFCHLVLCLWVIVFHLTNWQYLYMLAEWHLTNWLLATWCPNFASLSMTERKFYNLRHSHEPFSFLLTETQSQLSYLSLLSFLWKFNIFGVI